MRPFRSQSINKMWNDVTDVVFDLSNRFRLNNKAVRIECCNVKARHVVGTLLNATVILILMVKQIISREDVLHSFLYPRSTNKKGRTEISALSMVEEDYN